MAPFPAVTQLADNPITDPLVSRFNLTLLPALYDMKADRTEFTVLVVLTYMTRGTHYRTVWNYPTCTSQTPGTY